MRVIHILNDERCRHRQSVQGRVEVAEFTLVCRRMRSEWRIVHDHTSVGTSSE